MPYNPHEIEAKWQKIWEEENTFFCDTHDFSKPKYYVLDMFPPIYIVYFDKLLNNKIYFYI